MALLDTTVYVDLNGRGGKKRRLEAQNKIVQLLAAGDTLFTSRINVAELYVGVELGADPVQEQIGITDFLTWVAVLEFDDAAARSFGRIRADLQRRGKLVGDLDMLIAAVAQANGHSVVTRNSAHFSQIPGLTVITY